MTYPLVQYACDRCGRLSEVMDCDQPLPKGWATGVGRHTHYCPDCCPIDKAIKAESFEVKEVDINDEHPNAIDMSYLQNWYQDSIDETKEPIWTDKHLEELYEDFYLIPKAR